MKRKLGIHIECIAGMDPINTLDLIKKAGFECYFTGLNDPTKVRELINKGNSLGLTCESIHAPFKGINQMWLAEEDPEIFKNLLLQAKKNIQSLM